MANFREPTLLFDVASLSDLREDMYLGIDSPIPQRGCSRIAVLELLMRVHFQ